MKDLLLGIDVGTTSTKALLYDLSGNEVARASSHPYQNDTSTPGWVEQDPEQLWKAFLETITKVLQNAGKYVSVRAISIAAQSGSLIPADEEGNPVYPLITWLDGRTRETVTEWKAAGYESEVKAITGWSLYPGLCLPTIAWLEKNNPQVFRSAKQYFSVNDFLVYRLTGKKITNPSNAGGMQLVDLFSMDWSEKICKLAGIRKEQLSEIQPSGTIIGEVSAEICKLTGLTPGVVVVNGGHDQGCTAFSLGIVDPGKLLLSCGTAWVFTGVLDSLYLNGLPPTLDLNFHVAQQRWTLSQSLGGLGASFEWWVNKAWQSESLVTGRTEIYNLVNDELMQTEIDGGLFFLPMTGGHDNPATTKSGGFAGLQFNHSRANLARAIMESAGYELNWAIETIQQAGLSVEQLWMVGGAAQSEVWPSILSNVCNIPIFIPQYDNWPALGAALLAGTGIGINNIIDNAGDSFLDKTKRISPDNNKIKKYQAAFQKYKKYCDVLQ